MEVVIIVDAIGKIIVLGHIIKLNKEFHKLKILKNVENFDLKIQEKKNKKSKRQLQETIEKKTKELNEIAFKKDEKKYDYTLKALFDNKKENDKIFDFFEDSLNNIEFICQDKDIKS